MALAATRLRILPRTGEIDSDGGIAAGTPDLISGGVFVISAAVVQEVVNEGPATTHGQNDMVLDNWGEVTNWTAKAPVTSHGPSGIGFVNFGEIDRLDVQAPIETSVRARAASTSTTDPYATPRSNTSRPTATGPSASR